MSPTDSGPGVFAAAPRTSVGPELIAVSELGMSRAISTPDQHTLHTGERTLTETRA